MARNGRAVIHALSSRPINQQQPRSNILPMAPKENAAIQRADAVAYSPFKPSRCGLPSPTPPPPIPAPAASGEGQPARKRRISALGASIASGLLGGAAPYEDFLTTPEWVKKRRARPAQGAGPVGAPTSAARADGGRAESLAGSLGTSVKSVAGLVKEEASIASKIDWRGEVKAEIAGAGASLKQAASAVVSRTAAAQSARPNGSSARWLS
jgi:hypothetical protein